MKYYTTIWLAATLKEIANKKLTARAIKRKQIDTILKIPAITKMKRQNKTIFAH